MKENLEMKKLFLLGLLFGFNIANGADEFAEDPRLVYFRQVQKVAARLRKAATDAYGVDAKLTERVEFDEATKGGMLLEVGGAMGGSSHRASLITSLGKVCLYRVGVGDGGAEFLRKVSGGMDIEFDGTHVSDMAGDMSWMYGTPINPFLVVNLDGSECLVSCRGLYFKSDPSGGETMLSQEEQAEKFVGRLVVPSRGDGEVTYSLERYKGEGNFVNLAQPEATFDELKSVWRELGRVHAEERDLLEKEKTGRRKDLAPLFDDIDR